MLVGIVFAAGLPARARVEQQNFSKLQNCFVGDFSKRTHWHRKNVKCPRGEVAHADLSAIRAGSAPRFLPQNALFFHTVRNRVERRFAQTCKHCSKLCKTSESRYLQFVRYN